MFGGVRVVPGLIKSQDCCPFQPKKLRFLSQEKSYFSQITVISIVCIDQLHHLIGLHSSTCLFPVILDHLQSSPGADSLTLQLLLLKPTLPVVPPAPASLPLRLRQRGILLHGMRKKKRTGRGSEPRQQIKAGPEASTGGGSHSTSIMRSSETQREEGKT